MKQLYVKTERLNVLKVVGEATGQLVLENATCINAVKINRISTKLLETTNHLFNNKVITQGIIRKEVFFVDQEGRLRFTTEDVPFMMTVDIPGFKPNGFTKVQNHLLDIDVDYSLKPARQCLPGCLRQTIVAHILVVTAEWCQRDVVTKVDLLPTFCSTSPICRVKYC